MTWRLTCFRIWPRCWKKQLLVTHRTCSRNVSSMSRTCPGHVWWLSTWWCHFWLTSWDRHRRAAENEGECRARWLLFFHHPVSADEMHTSPWWQQCTTPPCSWPHTLQWLEQMQTVACHRQRCGTESGVHWRWWWRPQSMRWTRLAQPVEHCTWQESVQTLCCRL